MQRFGTHTIPSHVFGWHMIRRDFKTAVQSLLYNISDRGDALHCLQSGDAITLWKRLPDGPERVILKHLIEEGAQDFENAFRRIPRLLRMLYLHAYQSYIFNTVASLRFDIAFVQSRRPELTDCDLWKPLEGDLVMVDSKIHVVSHTDEVGGLLKITQVVLPLVGTSDALPSTNIACEPMEELLHSHGVDLQSLRRAFEVEHLLQPHERWEPQYRFLCVQSDLQVTFDDGADDTNPPGTVNSELHTLRLSFSLPPSAYATVALAPLIGFC